MKNSESIRSALQLAIEKAGSKAELSRKIGLEAMSIWRVVTGETRWIRDDTWQKLAPAIREFLPESGKIESSDSAAQVGLSAEEARLLSLYRSAPAASRKAAVETMEKGIVEVTLAAAKTG